VSRMRGLGDRLIVIIVCYGGLGLGGHYDNVAVTAHRRSSGMGMGQAFDMHHGLLLLGLGSLDSGFEAGFESGGIVEGDCGTSVT